MQQSIATQPPSEKFLRQRKFFLLLPIFVLPLVTFLLWSVGVVGSEGSRATTITHASGLNMTLPDAVPSKDSTWNKLNFYEQADKDAAKLASLMKNDPYYNLPLTETEHSIDTGLLPISTKPRLGTMGEAGLNTISSKRSGFNYDPYPSGLQSYKDPNETKVYQKLAELDAELNRNTVANEKKKSYASLQENSIAASVNTADIDRLESMMQMMQGDGTGGDPELQRINGMLDKILQIQHPDKVATEIKEKSLKNKGQVFTVGLWKEDNVSLLEGNSVASTVGDSLQQYASIRQEPTQRNGFYSLDEDVTNTAEQNNVIEAVIHETQTLVSGATVKLRLLSDVYINGLLIPKDQLVYGMSSLNGERLEIVINSIRYGNNILPVALSVYDMDGVAGVYMPGSITRDVSKQSTDQAIQSLGIASLDPSLGAQAASAGITAAKSLLSKKARLVKVTVKAGYQVLLRDDNQKNQ